MVGKVYGIIKTMLAIGKSKASQYSKNPCLLARDLNDTSRDVYFVPDASLPCMSCDGNAFDLIPKKEIFRLKKKYRVSEKTIRKIQNFYQSDKEVIDLKDDLGSRILMSEIEDYILGKLKKNYRDPNANYIPHYDAELSGKIAFHTTCYGASGVGKSHHCADIIRHNFEDSIIWIFSPTADSDPVWKILQKERGKKKVKLVNTSKIVAPVDLESQIGRGNVLVIDDNDVIEPANERYISALCSQAQYHGRHMTNRKGRGIVCFSILHDAFSRTVKSLKSTAVESTRVVIFPNQQRHNSRKIMKNRLGMSAKAINEIFDFVTPKDRWLMLVQHCPTCVITKTGIMLL